MSINKNDVILHSSNGVSLDTIQHGFKYKSKHKNKKGLWVYVYDDTKNAITGLVDKNENVAIKSLRTNDPTNQVLTRDIAVSKKAANNLVSSKNYDKSQTQVNSLTSTPNKKTHGRTVIADVSLRKKGTIHKSYDSILQKLGF